ncbi:MAG TPA: DUF6116 family protein [Candidatus Binatia bacterium]|nr:DUF6116 family protein [Candidatus Binatia bacterium]
MAVARASLAAPILGYLSRLRFPTLFLVAAGLFVADLLVPDMIPLVDELLLGIAALLLGRLRKRPEAGR